MEDDLFTRTRHKKTTIGEVANEVAFLTGKNLDEVEDTDIALTIHKKDKMKVQQEFAMVFIQNLDKVIDIVSKNELRVLVSIVKHCQFKNVFKVTQQAIADDLNLDKGNVSRAFKRLKELKLLLVDEKTKMEYVHPFLFVKGGLKEMKSTDEYKQLCLFHDDESSLLSKPF